MSGILFLIAFLGMGIIGYYLMKKVDTGLTHNLEDIKGVSHEYKGRD